MSTTSSRSSSTLRSVPEEATREDDAGSIVNDGLVGPLPLKLVRIFNEDREELHWGLFWSAFRRNHGDTLEKHGWHVVDCQSPTGDVSILTYRYQLIEPGAATAKHRNISVLAENVSKDARVCLITFSESDIDNTTGHNCISCVWKVVRRLVAAELLPQAAMEELESARSEEMKDPRKEKYHNAGASDEAVR